jgi:hypothetical protein
MSTKPEVTRLSRCRTIESLHQALDQTYRYLVETAKADWQRLFAGQDPTDDSVSVRVSKDEIAQELAGTPRAGLIRKQRKMVNRNSDRRLA